MSTPIASPTTETQGLHTDPQAFAELAEQHRRALQVHCYRILGSLHDAEDMVQETLLKAWKHIGQYEGRASFRSWLYRIATNTCLDFLDARRSRRELPFQTHDPADPAEPIQPPTSELLWLEPFPDEWLADAAAGPEVHYTLAESVSISFLIALQVLPARQRAVLILRDVLDFSASETAETLELTVSAVNSALSRARKTMNERYHGAVPETARPAPATSTSRHLLDHYVRAWQTADVKALVALLKRDAVLAMPPSPSWYRGRAAIARFAATTIFANGGMFPGKARNRWRLVPTRANGAPAFGVYQRTEGKHYEAFGLHVLSLDRNGRISSILSFIDPSLLPHFGLPLQWT